MARRRSARARARSGARLCHPLLSPRRRLVVFLHYYADLSYASIAEPADMSEGTVAATLAQARAALRVALECKEVPR
ncbi:MAG: sigma factor-like helix-turn-helix DNA-binding protein [Gaiellales bacterium]